MNRGTAMRNQSRHASDPAAEHPRRSQSWRKWLATALISTLALNALACSGTSGAGSKASGTTGTTSASGTTGTTGPSTSAPCAGPGGVGSPVPNGLGPGDLVSAVDLSPMNKSSPGFPTGARVWRVLYVSTGVDETDLHLICGMVAAPTGGPTTTNGVAHLLTWSHGTVGLSQNCLPSSDPGTLFWGKMVGGIGAIGWTDGVTKRVGEPQNGLLQYAMNKGWMVAASDYQPDNAYVIGRIAAGNQLDIMRAASQLMNQQFSKTAPSAYDTIVWGHSQGGHAAMWTGQLFDSYLAGTKPSKPTAKFTLKGVALLAPASNFLALPAKQPGVALGDGLMDSEMHQTLKPLGLPFPEVEIQIGPALLSYVFGSWNATSKATRQPSPTAAFPAFPIANTPLALDALVTPAGAATIAAVQPLCLNKSQAKKVDAATAPYRDAATNQMLIAPIWNLPPSGYKTADYFKGGMDTTCATTTNPEILNWCAWSTWNLPGPLGTNPFPKVPTSGGKPVPMMIGQGSNDTVIHCVSAKGSGDQQVPPPSDCMSSAFYNTLSSDAYCPTTGTVGRLELDVYRNTGPDSPGSHLSIPGEASAKALKNSAADLVFTGSPLQQFMTGAFAGSLAAGCTATVINK